MADFVYSALQMSLVSLGAMKEVAITLGGSLLQSGLCYLIQQAYEKWCHLLF